MDKNYSIVQYYPEQSRHKCGYCKKTNTNVSNGMWAHYLTVQDYQDLIDRGWRRSGKYCYKPVMDITCCPMYTIKCESLKFKPSKSQKKTIKRVNKFLSEGLKEKDNVSLSSEGRPESVSDQMHQYFHGATCADVNMDQVQTGDLQQLSSSNNLDQPMGDQNQINLENTSNLVKSNIPPSIDSKLDNKSINENSSDQTDEEKFNEKNKVDEQNLNEKDNLLKGMDFLANNFKDPNAFPQLKAKLESMSTENLINAGYKPGDGPDPTKPPCKKAKIARLERKRQKLEAAGKSIDTLKSSKPEATEKSLEQFLEEISQDPLHNLKISLVRTNPKSPEWEKTFKQTYDLYVKYQISIHGDPAEKCDVDRFTRFLVDSPLKLVLKRMHPDEETFELSAKLYEKYQLTIHKDTDCDIINFQEFLVDTPIKPSYPSNGPPHGYGSFHQQYWLDDNLIAVGVIDILPNCVSSVYFFYDPDYSFLSLGTYGSLRELQLTRELFKISPQLKYYYMGYYIHTCPKMRYKANLSPSYLLCPETYFWFPIEKCIPILDVHPYSRFNDDPNAQDANACSRNEINNVIVLITTNMTAMRYRQYRLLNGSQYDQEIIDYANLVGKKCAFSMFLLRDVENSDTSTNSE